MGKIEKAGTGSPSVISHDLTIDGDLTVNDNLVVGTAASEYIFLGDDMELRLGNTTAASDVQLLWETADADAHYLNLVIGSASRNLIISEDAATDWGHAAQTNPTVFLQSSNASDTAQWLSLTHDQTNAVIDSGTGGVSVPDLRAGIITLPEDGGLVDVMDMAVTATPAATTDEGYNFCVDGTPVLTVLAEADSSGSIQNPELRVTGIGTFSSTVTMTPATAVVGLTVDQDNDATGIAIDTEAPNEFGLTINGKYGAKITQDIVDGYALTVTRNINAAESQPLMNLYNDHASDTQATLSIGNDGSGAHIITRSANESLKVIPNGTGALLLGANANVTDFSNTLAVISKGDTGVTTVGSNIALALESVADGSQIGYSLYAATTTSSAKTARGVYSVARVAAATDAFDAVGIFGTANTAHTAADNIGVLGSAINASSSGSNIAVDCSAGDLRLNNTAAQAAGANKFHISASDLSGGNTQLSLYGEGTCIGAGTPNQDTTIALTINGTQYYILASASAG